MKRLLAMLLILVMLLSLAACKSVDSKDEKDQKDQTKQTTYPEDAGEEENDRQGHNWLTDKNKDSDGKDNEDGADEGGDGNGNKPADADDGQEYTTNAVDLPLIIET